MDSRRSKITHKRAMIAGMSVFFVAKALFGFAWGDPTARIEDGWIIASQGKDESLQIVRVKVWGPERVTGAFYQLDSYPKLEYVVVSRGLGTGPYYKLQIIDFRANGILTWAYDSSGGPRIEDGVVSLGYLPDGYQGAATMAVYEEYEFTVEGLVKIRR